MPDLFLAFGHKLGLHVEAVPACPACPHLCNDDDCGHCCTQQGDAFVMSFERDGIDGDAYCNCEQHTAQYAAVYAPLLRKR